MSIADIIVVVISVTDSVIAVSSLLSATTVVPEVSISFVLSIGSSAGCFVDRVST